MSKNGKPSSLDLEKDPGKWYSSRFELYLTFTRLLHATVENLMRATRIDYLSVASRTKSMGSLVEKMARKGYESVNELTDLTGIRIITFIEADAATAARMLEQHFTVLPEKSLDKSEELGDSQVGYRSIHLICKLGKDRTVLPEYEPFKELLFEVQVRTVLQHAWAEIDHDRSYKFSGVLPAGLRRRLNLLAGQLELADKEFSRLAKDVDRYTAELRQKGETGDLNVELSSASLIEFLRDLSQMHSLSSIHDSDPSGFATVIDELDRFGIETLEGVKQLFSGEFLNEFKNLPPESRTRQVGLLRKAMMYADIDKYFTQAWRGEWKRLTRSSQKLIATRWGETKLQSIRAMLLTKNKS